VPSRLWLGGDLSPTRDGALVTATLRRVAACAASTALLLCVDGFAAYVGAVRTVFRVAVHTGRPGRPRLVLPETVLLAQVVKSHNGRRLVDVTRRVVFGTAEAVTRAIAATRGGTQINTSYCPKGECISSVVLSACRLMSAADISASTSYTSFARKPFK